MNSEFRSSWAEQTMNRIFFSKLGLFQRRINRSQAAHHPTAGSAVAGRFDVARITLDHGRALAGQRANNHGRLGHCRSVPTGAAAAGADDAH